VKTHLQNPQLDENGVGEKVFEDKSCQTCCYAYLRKYHQDANTYEYEACSMGMIPIQEWKHWGVLGSAFFFSTSWAEASGGENVN
jgi:hypothetical protein